MLLDAAFPGPLPLGREAALDVLARLDDFADTGGTFLSFVMIPVEERIGEWRFAGSSASLAEAFRRLDEFADAMLLTRPGATGYVRGVLEMPNIYDVWTSPGEAPIDGLGRHRVVLCAEGGAPYDDTGLCLVEVPSLAESGFEDRPPETVFPQEWGEQALEWVLEHGSERLGDAPPEVEEAIRAEERPEVWALWCRHLAAVRTWEELLSLAQNIPDKGE